MANLNSTFVLTSFLLFATLTRTAAWADSGYSNKCALITCPESSKCPEDSRISQYKDVLSDDEGSDAVFELQPVPVVHFRTVRDLSQSSYSDLELQCCVKNMCSCNKCPERPTCEADQFLIELSSGNGQPGSCCSSYTCGAKPACVADVSVAYWLNSCTRCNSCEPLCSNMCDQEPKQLGHCLSTDNELKLHGETWEEAHGCTQCICLDGNNSCQANLCKIPECDNPIELPDQCCKVCPELEPAPPVVVAEEAKLLEATTEISLAASTSKSSDNSTESTHLPEPAQPETDTTSEGPLDTTNMDNLAYTSSTTWPRSSTTELLEDTTESTTLPKLDETPSTEAEATTEHEQFEKPETSSQIALTSDASDLLESSTKSTQLENNTTQALNEHSVRIEERSSTSAPAARSTNLIATSIVEELTATNVQPLEETTQVDRASSEYSSSSSSTEFVGLFATSSPAPQTPESTSWHHNAKISDEEYHFAQENHNDALMHSQSYNNLWLIIPCCVVIVICATACSIFCLKNKKHNAPNKMRKTSQTLYSSVPNSDDNLTENTNASDLVLYIEQPLEQKKLPQ